MYYCNVKTRACLNILPILLFRGLLSPREGWLHVTVYLEFIS